MPWQRQVAEVAGEYDPATGLPYYREVVVTVPRQSGKTTLYLTWQIHRCTSPQWSHPQRSVFTAQSGKDARDKWLDELFPAIRKSPKIRRLVASRGSRLAISEGMGNESIRWKTGSLIRLLSTSSSSGHSKTLHQAVLDEIWHDVDPRREQGLRPAMVTVPDAQLLACSTAGTEASLVYNRKVQQGRAAVERDAGHGLAYFEFSAPDDWDPLDEESYFGFMPALCPDPPCRCGDGRWRHTVTLDVIRGEREGMEPLEFARAYGNRPPVSTDNAKIPDSVWSPLEDPRSQMCDPVAFAVDMAVDRSWAAIGVCGLRSDGRLHGEVVDYRQGTDWLVERIVELNATWRPCAWVLDPGSPAGALIRPLAEGGVTTVCGCHDGPQPAMEATSRQIAQSCGGLFDDCVNDRWRHLGQGHLSLPVSKAATKRAGDGAWLWSREDSPVEISPLVAVTLARLGLETHGRDNPYVIEGSLMGGG